MLSIRRFFKSTLICLAPNLIFSAGGRCLHQCRLILSKFIDNTFWHRSCPWPRSKGPNDTYAMWIFVARPALSGARFSILRWHELGLESHHCSVVHLFQLWWRFWSFPVCNSLSGTHKSRSHETSTDGWGVQAYDTRREATRSPEKSCILTIFRPVGWATLHFLSQILADTVSSHAFKHAEFNGAH